jgi:hypothetical protein
VTKVSVPRTDLAMRVDGQGLTSGAAFEAAGSESMLTGDVVLTEDEVIPALSAAFVTARTITLPSTNRAWFSRVGGHGPSECLATGVKATLRCAGLAR